MSPGVELISPRARALLSPGALRRVLRDAAQHAGEQWLAEFLPRRFESGYAVQLGYRTSQRRSAWAARRNLPATYDERKRAYAGHSDPCVFTGHLRARVFQQARATATVPSDTLIRLAIRLGRLPVKNRTGQIRELPATHVVRRTLTALLPHEVSFVTTQMVAAAGARLRAVSAPVQSAKRLPPPPPETDAALIEARRRRAEQLAAASSAQAAIGARMQEQHLRRLGLWEQWRQQSGGSAPVGGRARTPEERRAAHRAQALASYYRRRAHILARRRLRRRAASVARRAARGTMSAST